MATFTKRTWVDRVSEQPQRRLLTPTNGGEAMTVDVTRQEGMVVQEGDAFSASNMNDLENRIKTSMDANNDAIASVQQKANTNQTNIATLTSQMTTVTGKVTTIEGELTANGKRIYMDYKDGKYGYNTSANRGADTFFPFKAAVEASTDIVLVGTGSSYTVKNKEDGLYLIISAYISDVGDWNVPDVPSVIVTKNGGSLGGITMEAGGDAHGRVGGNDVSSRLRRTVAFTNCVAGDVLTSSGYMDTNYFYRVGT